MNISAVLTLLAGLASVLTVLLIHIPTEHPFNRPNGYAEEFGMTKAEIEAFNPEAAHWMIHVSDQVGSTSLGWGLFLIALALLGIRRGNKTALWALWIGGKPTAAYSAFHEYILFGTFDIGSLLSAMVLFIFLLGMLLPIGIFRQLREPATFHRTAGTTRDFPWLRRGIPS